jgi:Fe2+ or Zn2+ uptake regulation protein
MHENAKVIHIATPEPGCGYAPVGRMCHLSGGLAGSRAAAGSTSRSSPSPGESPGPSLVCGGRPCLSLASSLPSLASTASRRLSIILVMPDTTPWMTALDDAGYFVTEPRRVVAGMVAERDSHFTANDLVGEAKRSRLGVGRATVFRALELFERLGLVERLDLPSGGHAYVVCQPAHHHHHVICTGCGRSAEVGDLGASSIATDVEAQTGFALDSHRIELYGLCPECRTTGVDHLRPRIQARTNRSVC